MVRLRTMMEGANREPGVWGKSPAPLRGPPPLRGSIFPASSFFELCLHLGDPAGEGVGRSGQSGEILGARRALHSIQSIQRDTQRRPRS